MDLFAKFKENLKKTLAAVKKPGDPAYELVKAIDAPDNWESLERLLVEHRTRARRRQQEVMERLEPLAQRVEETLAKAKETKVKVIRQNLMRQVESYMDELEAEDEPAKIHSSNARMLTNVIKQVQRARAMSERGIGADAIDAIATQLEEIVVDHETAMEAMDELDSAGEINTGKETSPAAIEERLAAIYDTGEDDQAAPAESSDDELDALEKRLLEE